MQKYIYSSMFYKNLERFRLITFDITDTLLRFRLKPGQQFAKTASDFGVTNIDEESLKICFHKEFKQMSIKYPNFGRESNMIWQNWWIEVVERTFLCTNFYTGGDEMLRRIAETLVKVYRTKECWEYCDGCQELLRGIRAAEKQLGCISNFDPSLSKVLQEMAISNYFHFILTSYDANVQKPNVEIFNAALKKSHTNEIIGAAEALHIGNTYELDYVGARNAGWSSLLITNDINHANDIRKEHIFKDLRDLLNTLNTKDLTKIF